VTSIQVTTNIIRPLPPNMNIYFDPDEDEPSLEPSWPHLSVRHVAFCTVWVDARAALFCFLIVFCAHHVTVFLKLQSATIVCVVCYNVACRELIRAVGWRATNFSSADARLYHLWQSMFLKRLHFLVIARAVEVAG